MLGSSGGMWWEEEGPCVVAVCANVGSMHCGSDVRSGESFVIDTELLGPAKKLASFS